MMAITTRSSIRVNPASRVLIPIPPFPALAAEYVLLFST
jgi:hypothetical protein